MLIKLGRGRSAGGHDLVDLLAECHQRIRHFSALACEVARRKDAPAEQVSEACADVARYFTDALPLHVLDEEEALAPRLRGLSREVDQALEAMTAQHGQHTERLLLLLRALAEVRRVPGSDSARAQLLTTAEPLKDELEHHLALEERVIFPAIRAGLPSETQTLIIDELRRRRQVPREAPPAAGDEP